MLGYNLKNIGWTILNVMLLVMAGSISVFAQDAGSTSGGGGSAVQHSSSSTTTTTTSSPDLPASNTWIWIAVAAIAFLILIVILARSGSSRRVERHTTVVK